MARLLVCSLVLLAGAVVCVRPGAVVCIRPDAGAAPPLPTAPPPRPAGEPLLPEWPEDPGIVPEIEPVLPGRDPKAADPLLEPRLPPPLENPLSRLDPLPGLGRDDFRKEREWDMDGRKPVAPARAFDPFVGRRGKAKADLLAKYGGTRESERAVGLGLAWLARQQGGAGSWAFDGQIAFQEERVGATGMALLPFLAAGVTHLKSAEPLGEFIDGKGYEKVVARGLGYLKTKCPLEGARPGRLSTDVYANAIAALALCEAFAMTKDPDLKPYAQAAVDYIQKTQGPNGSWGYGNSGNGDTSIFGWQIDVLKVAKLSKELTVRNEAIEKANRFLELVSTGSRKSMYGYQDKAGAAPGTALTAVGLLCRYRISDWGPLHPGMVDGAAGLLKQAPEPRDPLAQLYFHYHAAQVLFAVGGEDWQTWNEGSLDKASSRRVGGMRDWLVKYQARADKGGKKEDDGSWDKESPGIIGSNCGRLGTTCMCLLTLEVYYRHLPLYGRGPRGEVVRVFE